MLEVQDNIDICDGGQTNPGSDWFVAVYTFNHDFWFWVVIMSW